MNAKSLKIYCHVEVLDRALPLNMCLFLAIAVLASGCRGPSKQVSPPPTAAAMQATPPTLGLTSDAEFTAGPYTDDSPTRDAISLAEVGAAALPNAAEPSAMTTTATRVSNTSDRNTDASQPANLPKASFVPYAQTAPDLPGQLAQKTSSDSDGSAGLSSTTAASPEASTAAAADIPPHTDQRPKSTGLTIRIHGVLPNQGPIRVAAFDDPKEFPDPKSASWVGAAESTEPAIEIASPASGQVAIAAFQDINNDGQLNRGRFGVPLEPYAFSNQAQGTRGPPPFAEAAIVVTQPNAVIDIQLPDFRNLDLRNIR